MLLIHQDNCVTSLRRSFKRFPTVWNVFKAGKKNEQLYPIDFDLPNKLRSCFTFSKLFDCVTNLKSFTNFSHFRQIKARKEDHRYINRLFVKLNLCQWSEIMFYLHPVEPLWRIASFAFHWLCEKSSRCPESRENVETEDFPICRRLHFFASGFGWWTSRFWCSLQEFGWHRPIFDHVTMLLISYFLTGLRTNSLCNA